MPLWSDIWAYGESARVQDGVIVSTKALSVVSQRCGCKSLTLLPVHAWIALRGEGEIEKGR